MILEQKKIENIIMALVTPPPLMAKVMKNVHFLPLPNLASLVPAKEAVPE